jgi:hypothetical protein
MPVNESFQSGGNVTLVTRGLVSRISNPDIQDPTGLGRWNGVTLRGSNSQTISIITACRVCSGSPRTAPMGTSFLREYDFLRETTSTSKNPRRAILQDLKLAIRSLQEKEHSILLMIDANSTIQDDYFFAEFVQECSFYDLHIADPAVSTYIGAEARRIDFMFGCVHVKESLVRSGTLSYFEGPQSDHRGLYADIKISSLKQNPIPVSRPRHDH